MQSVTKQCIPECKHRGASSGPMIRCCLCAKWYHEDCLSLTEDDHGVWPCPVCRQINTRVENLSGNVSSILDMVSEIRRILLSHQTKYEGEISKLKEDNGKLLQENKDLRQTVADLRTSVNKLTWKSFRKDGQRSHVLIGSSIIRDVTEEKLHDTEVICKRGGNISDVKTVVENLNPGYESITLVVGGNDCGASSPKPAENIVSSFGGLIDSAKSKSQDVIVTSICPRLTSEDTQERIEAVNAGLLAICNEREKVEFRDLSNIFKLADGSVNDGYIQKDGVHITQSAMNKIASKLNLKIKNQKEGVCKTERGNGSRGSNYATQMPARSRPRQKLQVQPTLSNSPASWCFNCGEPNHVRDRCRHSAPLQCHRCKHSGHKAKFCEYYDISH